MRVFRSRSPEGPYEDAVHPNAGNDLRYTEHHNYGVKIMGGYKFVNLNEELPTGTIAQRSRSTGYLSPGHNSVYYDSAAGRYFLIYHQRFEGRGEFHEVRVHEMFLNKDGWFVTAPFRHDGGTIRSFSPDSLSGTWKLINHGKENNVTPVESHVYQFLKNGRITGTDDSEGTWELGSDNKTANITLNGVPYNGVFLRCYDEDNNQWVQAFTAMSQDGIALWGAGVVINKD